MVSVMAMEARQNLDISNEPVAQEFLLVFLAHLPGAPSDHEIESMVDLILGASLISKLHIGWPQLNLLYLAFQHRVYQ